MLMLRSFLPVGQGAFYIEQFNFDSGNINVVYDCGSRTGVKLVESEIRNNFLKDEQIKYVFISHLDSDHVNGLQYLLNYCKVETVVMPYFEESDRCVYKINYLITSPHSSKNSFTYRLIDDSEGTIKRESESTKILHVMPYGEENNYNELYSSKYRRESLIESGTRLSCEKLSDNDKWIFVPFNIFFHDRKKIFINQLRGKIGMKEKLSDDELLKGIIANWSNKETQKKVKEVYKKITDGVNVNSLTLYSGKNKSSREQNVIQVGNCCVGNYLYYYDYKQDGCLYLGDYDASNNWDKLESTYKDYRNYIGCVQIPHHGSNKSFNNEILKIDAYKVISAGKKNEYNHPNASVIKEFLLREEYPFIVSEDCESKVTFGVY